MLLGRKRQGGRLDRELSSQPCEVGSRESPVEGRRHALVILLEAQQSLRDLLDAGEIIGGEGFALDDGEVDLDLVEPTGVNRAVDRDQVGKGVGQASHAGRPAMRGAIIHNPEYAAGITVGWLSHDLGDEPSERSDAGGWLAPAEDFGAVYIERSQVGPCPGAGVLVFDARGGKEGCLRMRA